MEAYVVALGIFTAIYLLLSLALNLQFGLTGLINFGLVGFFCIGAYAAALAGRAGVPTPLAFAAAALLAAAAAWPIGLISLKLRDDYFAIVTLGFSEVVRVVALSEGWLTGGVQGVFGIPRLFTGMVDPANQPRLLLAVLMGVNILAMLGMRRIASSPFGRTIEAIRDNEEAVRSLGKEPAGYKMRVLMLGAALSGVAGAFYARYIGYISPEQFVPLITFQVWMATVMGGVGRVSGALVGTVILMLLLEGSRFLRDVAPFIPDVEMASIRLGAIGLALILFTLLRPQGIVGDYTRR